MDLGLEWEADSHGMQWSRKSGPRGVRAFNRRRWRQFSIWEEEGDGEGDSNRSGLSVVREGERGGEAG